MTFCRNVDINRSKENRIGGLPYNASDGVVSDIPIQDVLSRECSLDDEVTFRHFDEVEVFFVVDKPLFLGDAWNATLAALGLAEEVKFSMR